MVSQFEIESALSCIGRHLAHPARLMLIGSGVGMLHGQPSRMTHDIDVWRPESEIDVEDMRQACDAARVLFDPEETDEDAFYLQMISPGIVHLGRGADRVSKIAQYHNLEVVRPPIANVIASKLMRGDERDIEDVIFLRRKFNVSREEIEAVIESLPEHAAETAKENMIYFDMLDAPRGDPEKEGGCNEATELQPCL